MNKLTTTKTKPVTQNVIVTVSSIMPQLRRSAGKHHGQVVKETEPTTSKTNTIAKADGGPG
jgi:hypothetical protein